jgi:hypothetical protein
VSAATAVCDVEAAVLAGFLAELMVVDLTRPRVLGRLRSAAHEAGALARREISGAPIPQAHLFTAHPPRSSARHPDLVLARAVAARAITRGEAALIGSTRLEPTSLAEVAVRRGQPYRAVRAARIRAERKLSVFLRDRDTGSIETFLSHTETRTSTARSSTAPTGTGTGRGVGGEHPRGQTRRRSRRRAIDAGRTDRRPAVPASTPGPAPAEATQARSPAHAPGGDRRDGATAATGTPPAPLPPTPRRRIRRRRGVATPATLHWPTSPARAEASSASTPAPSVRLDSGSTAEPVVPGPGAATVDATDATARNPPGRAVAAVVNPGSGDRS